VTYSPARSVEAHDADSGGHLAMWFFGVLGALTIATGLWLSTAPDGGQFSLPFLTIDLSSVPELLGPGLLLGGGIVFTASMFSGAWRDYHFDEGWLLVWVQGLLGVFGIVAALLGLLGMLDRMDLYTFSALPF